MFQQNAIVVAWKTKRTDEMYNFILCLRLFPVSEVYHALIYYVEWIKRMHA
jgi:hypothetical protein